MSYISYKHEKPNYFMIALIIVTACVSIYICLIKNPKLLVQTPLVEGLNKYEKTHNLVTPYQTKVKEVKARLQPNNYNQIELNTPHSYVADRDLPISFPFPKVWDTNLKDDYTYKFTNDHLLTINNDRNIVNITHLTSLNSWRLIDENTSSTATLVSAASNSIYWISNQKSLNLFDINTSQLIWSRILSSNQPQLLFSSLEGDLIIISKTKQSTYLTSYKKNSGEISLNVKLNFNETILKIQDTKNYFYLYGEETFYKLKKSNGKVVWSRPSLAPIVNNVLIEGRSIYLATTAGQLVSINTKNGEKNWEHSAEQPFEGEITLIPVLNRVSAMTRDGSIHTLDAITGEVRWKLKLKKESTNSDLLSVKLNNKVIMKFNLPWNQKAWTLWTQCASRSICILDPRNGRVLVKFSNKNPVTHKPHFIKDQFILIGENKKSIEDTTLNYYQLIK